jgi:hypothetical protein
VVGLTAMLVSVGAVALTVRAIVLLAMRAPTAAETVTEPVMTPVASPLASTDAVLLSEDVHVMPVVSGALVPSLYLAVAESCRVPLTPTVRAAGEIVKDMSVLGTVVTERGIAALAMVPSVAVTFVAPAFKAVASPAVPVAEKLATLVSEDFHVTLAVMSIVELPE